MRDILIPLIVMIFLSGCVGVREPSHPTAARITTTSIEETSTSTTTSTTTTTMTTTTSTTLLEFKYPELEDCEKLRKNARDDCYYDVAVDKRDFSLCDEIESNLLRTVCVAAEKKNKGICDFINDSQTQDKCYYGVAVSKGDEGICSYIELEILRDTCYLKISKNKKDKGICNKIKFPTIQNLCLTDCRITEIFSDMIGTVEKEDHISATIRAEKCRDLGVGYKTDLDYLSLINQSTSKVSAEGEEIYYEFMCLKDKPEVYLYLTVGNEKITKKAACRTFTPIRECTIQLLANESTLNSRITEDVDLVILAENCGGERVSYYVKPENLTFTGWSFNNVFRKETADTIQSNLEKINISFECNDTYDGILVKIKVDGRGINNYVTCRIKPECSITFLEEKSKLEADVGGEVYLTALARECKGREVESSGELTWLSLVNLSTEVVESNREEITVTYRCERSTDLFLFIELSVGAGEEAEDIVRYARCRS